MKLSLRLATALENALPWQPFWDICCDHGLLGIQALRSEKFPQVHFVDQVPQLIENLQVKIKAKEQSLDKAAPLPAYFYSIPAENLKEKLSGNICVLGIGAQKMEIFLKAWENSELLQAQRLILSPHKDEKWFLEKVIPELENYQLQKQIDLCERGRKRSLFILDRRNS